MRTIGIVEAGLELGPHGGRLTRKLGGKSLLEWVVRRATECQQLDEVVVLTASTASAWIAELVPPDVPIFSRGAEQDVLSAYCTAVDSFNADAAVRVCAHSPFLDPALIDRLVTTAAEHPNCDYVSYCSRSGQQAIHSPVGIFAEWCRADALRQADWEATDDAERLHVARYLYARPEKFSVRLLPVPDKLDRDDVRLAVHSQEDWEHTETIFEALGPDRLDWQRIAGLLEDQPALRERMAVLNQSVTVAD